MATRARKRKSKFNNRKVMVGELSFDSAKEAKRYRELRLLEVAGEIENLERQKKYLLIPLQRKADGSAEYSCSYFADFVYTQDGRVVVEDVKGVLTGVYVIKRKLMLQEHGIEIKEV